MAPKNNKLHCGKWERTSQLPSTEPWRGAHRLSRKYRRNPHSSPVRPTDSKVPPAVFDKDGPEREDENSKLLHSRSFKAGAPAQLRGCNYILDIHSKRDIVQLWML